MGPLFGTGCSMAFSALVVITTLVAKTEMGWALGEYAGSVLPSQA